MRYWFIIIALYALTPSASSAADYRKIETAHFVFYFHHQDEKLMRSLIPQAEAARRAIVEDLGIDFQEKTGVYLASSFRKYQEIQPAGEIPSWSAGVAYPGLNLIIMRSPRSIKGKAVDLKKLFKHEFTHIAMGKAFQGREMVPRWLDEGLAMYESREWDLSRISTITRAVLTGSLIPLSEITHRFPLQAEQAELAYSESFYLISFLINEYGTQAFHRFINQYSRGKALKDVLMKVYGITWEELEKNWYNYLKVRFSWLPIITSSTTLWFLLTIAFILAYMRKRKATRLKYEQWDSEDETINYDA